MTTPRRGTPCSIRLPGWASRQEAALAKKRGRRGGKDKGRGAYSSQDGMGRLRRAFAPGRVRDTGLERIGDDEDALEAHESVERRTNAGEGLIAKFNRLARDTADADGTPGTVCGFDGVGMMVRLADGSEHACQVRAVLKKMLSGVKSPLVVGDDVRVDDLEGDPVVTALLPRRNQLARADSHNKALEHIFAANIDHLVIVAALAMPELKTGLIDRYLTIAHHNEIEPVIVLNKIDLAHYDDIRELYASLGYQVFATDAARGTGDIEALRSFLRGHSCVFAGQSGVGKSSLIKALYPAIDLRIGDVSTVQRKGRHTTTASRSYLLPDGGCLIDTPGIRECGITGMTPLDVALLYPDIAHFHQDCRFNDCSHRHEPDCAVVSAVEAGALDPRRYFSYVSIIDEDLTA